MCVCTIYGDTCLKRNIGLTATCLRRKKFTVRKIWSPDDPYLKYLHQKQTSCKRKNFGPLGFHYRQVSLHNMQVDCGIAAFTSEVNPASPNRHSEYCLLSEERTAFRKDPQQILVLCNSAPARGLQKVWRMYKRLQVRLTDPLCI
jgi:hypothetical protein